MCCKLLISFLLTVFVKLLSSTCDILQLPLHVAPLLNFVRRNTRVTCRKKSSYPSILPVSKAELFSGVNWLSVYLMNSERCSTSISPSRQQWLSSHQSSCANQSKDSEASILPLSSILKRCQAAAFNCSILLFSALHHHSTGIYKQQLFSKGRHGEPGYNAEKNTHYCKLKSLNKSPTVKQSLLRLHC